MIKTGIVIPKGAVMPSAVISPYFLLLEANKYLAETGREPVFEVMILGSDETTALYNGIFTVRAHTHYADSPRQDLIVIPGFICDMEEPLAVNRELVEWLKVQYLERETELASLCTGAFLVAATGLANGRNCTTHWAFEAAFRARFPKVNLLAENIVTDDNGLYASAGAYSSLNLILYLVEKFCERETANWLSKVFQIDIDRSSQKPFAIFNQQRSHIDDPVTGVQEYIETHFREELSVQRLAERFAFSRRNLIRRFKEATGNTPIEYIQRVRIESAKRMLETTRKSVEEIIYESGYNDGKTFRAVFRKYTGLSPSIYRNRYGRF
ncbi:MAG TPA: helix-turn-helix domain-containing protein [Flavilitoribacter sp.]|nr:helix-turn-helix domain-containing protein [Flavilitoribacter sp.]